VAAKDVASAQQALADAQKNLQSVQAQIAASTQSDKVAVANAQQALTDGQKSSQTVPAVITQQIEQAKDKLYADQVADDASVGRGAMTQQARQAALDADQAAIDQANASAQQTLAQSQASVSQAQQALNTANANLKNDAAKYDGNLVAAQTQLNTAQSSLASTQAKDAQSVQSAQAQVASAQGSLTVAQANYAKAAAPSAQADLDGAKAQIANAQGSVTLAQNNVDAAKLTAPSDGTVTGINGAVGQWITGGALSGSAAASASGASSTTSSSFIDLTSLNGLQITAQVNEADVSNVKVGQPVSFTVDAFPGKTFTGKVAEIQPLGQTVSNVVSYSVVMDIDQTNVQLLPGMTASATIVTDQQQNALQVPVAALAYANSHSTPAKASGAEQAGGSGVLYVLQNGQPASVPVQFGISNGKVVQVTSGISKGEQVVTGGGASVAAKSSSSASTSKTTSPLTGGGGPAGGPRPGGQG
jgi:HlyD family secretion protein